MAFVHTSDRQIFGTRRVVIGTFTNDSGSTGGDINTQLDNVHYFHANGITSETRVGGVVTLVTPADAVGDFIAIGD